MRRIAPLAALAAACLMVPAAAIARTPTWTYLSHPTDQLAIPGVVAGTEVTPEGYLYTGWTELVFRYGQALTAWRQPIRTLQSGRYPVLGAGRRRDGVAYTVTAFADLVEGAPVDFVRVTLRNVSSHPREARFAAGLRWSGGALKRDGVTRRYRFPRPVAPTHLGFAWQPGAAFDPVWTYAFAGDTVTRDGRVLLLFPAPDGALDVRTQLRPDGAGAVRPATVFGLAGVHVPLAPGQVAHLDYKLPVVPLDAGSPAVEAVRSASFDAHRGALVDGWRSTFARAIRIDVPERKVRDAFDASLLQILQSRYTVGGAWVQTVNKLRYHAFWLRDAAMMTHALDLAGLHAEAEQNLRFFGAWQRDDGLFISRAGQYDGIGQALWAIGEHVRRTGDLAFAREQLGRLDRAVAWIDRARAADPLGLLPASDPRDNELVQGHLVGDDAWAIAGLEAVVGLAHRLGDADRAAAWGRELDSLRATLRAHVAVAARANSGVIPPALDAQGGEDWGNLWAAWPARALPARSAAVSATLRRARTHFREGIATYGSRRALHAYLGFRVFETELARGEQAHVVAGLYDSLAHTTASHGGFETGVLPFAKRAVDDNLAPHGWFAAEYIELLRNMLVREDGDTIELLGAVPPLWLARGQRVAVRGAPTAFGLVDVTLRPRAGGATLSWRARVPAGTPLRWRLPATATRVRARGLRRGARTLALPGREGTLRIGWRLRRGHATSFAATARGLAAHYRARGLQPPAGIAATALPAEAE